MTTLPVSAWTTTRATSSASASASRSRSGLVMEAAPCSKIEVCTSTYGKMCLRKGGRKTLAMFEELAATTDIEIVEVDCLDECTSGPNARLDEDDRRIVGGLRTKEQIAEVLGVDPS
eukprot:FR742050.1.p1 GENE.FR742050.1~~FR742050.1.p1  ORF type:complete len:135 (+),score=13.47 FR742050.1:56-406(+)